MNFTSASHILMVMRTQHLQYYFFNLDGQAIIANVYRKTIMQYLQSVSIGSGAQPVAITLQGSSRCTPAHPNTETGLPN